MLISQNWSISGKSAGVSLYFLKTYKTKPIVTYSYVFSRECINQHETMINKVCEGVSEKHEIVLGRKKKKEEKEEEEAVLRKPQ